MPWFLVFIEAHACLVLMNVTPYVPSPSRSSKIDFDFKVKIFMLLVSQLHISIAGLENMCHLAGGELLVASASLASSLDTIDVSTDFQEWSGEIEMLGEKSFTIPKGFRTQTSLERALTCTGDCITRWLCNIPSTFIAKDLTMLSTLIKIFSWLSKFVWRMFKLYREDAKLHFISSTLALVSWDINIHNTRA